MFYRLKTTLARSLFNLQCRRVLHTPPLRLSPAAGFTVLSQIRHSDLLMYLLAIKSFARQLAPAAIHIIDDGTLTAADRALLARHLPGSLVHSTATLTLPHCPRGGTWERLIAISHLVQHSYVIQLDADTLTLDAIAEVAACIRDQRSFCIGTWDEQTAETMQERIEVARKHAVGPRPHVQLVAEAGMNALAGFESMRYIRGCSGFSGFARASFDPQRLDELSRQMGEKLGKRWAEWGTEQFMSNVIVANSPNPCVLPHPRYCDCSRYDRERTVRVPAFVHFIGTCRFHKGRYARAAGSLIQHLQAVDDGPRPAPV
jgi:hypothetical protein